MKKSIFGILLAFSMILGMEGFALADDGLGGVEEVLLQENFETSVSYEDGATEVVLGRGADVYNNWKISNTSGTNYNDPATYKIVKEDENQSIAISKQSWTGNDGIISMTKAINTVETNSNLYHLSFRLKRGTANPGNISFEFGGAQWIIRFDNGRLYAGAYGNSAGDSFYTFSADKWYDVEIVADYANKKYSYYVNSEVVVSPAAGETTEVRSINPGVNTRVPDSLSISAVRNNLAGTSGAQVYIDDIVLTALDEKRVCEIAAEKMSVTSTASTDITLPTTGFAGTTVSWKSNNTALITDSGAVTIPESGGIQAVTLTATITKGDVSVEFPYIVKVLPSTVYYYEDFQGAAEGPLTSYDAWGGGHTSGADYDNVFESNIVSNTPTNKAMEIRRAKLPDPEKRGSSYYSVYKTLSNAPSSATVSVKMNLSYDNYVWPCVILSDGTNQQSVMFRTNWSTIYNPTTGGNYINNIQMLAGKEHSIEFRVDTVLNKIELIFDGRAAFETETALTTVSEIGFYENRTGLNGSESTNEIFYIDNIVVETVDISHAYTIVDFEFINEDGGAVIYPSANTKVSSVVVKKNKAADNAVMLVAVYEENRLSGISELIDITGAKIDADNYYTVNLPIKDDNTKIKAFVLDETNFAPLTYSETYEKRTPLNIFIAGDSMAENVAGSTSTKMVNGELVSYAREGWGMRIGEQFADGAVRVSNKAVGGRDTVEFVNEGRFDSILSEGQRGDFVLISFGHNDQGSSIPVDTYKENLISYSQAIRKKGMNPIFITPITRISTVASETDTLTPDANLKIYAEAMIAAAEASGDVCLDLNSAYSTFLEGMQYSEIRNYFVPKEIDGTHLSPAGAQKAAELIAELLGSSDSSLKQLLK